MIAVHIRAEAPTKRELEERLTAALNLIREGVENTTHDDEGGSYSITTEDQRENP